MPRDEHAEGLPARTPPPIVIAQPRDPGSFTGSGDQEVEDWIDLYERISAHNRWDNTIMLANVLFYLKDTARVWFLTHEEDITSWDMCKTKLIDLFGRPTGRKLAAKRKLASRTQTSTESYITYIQDILSLCRKANPEMPDADRVSHILKGIADDAFQLLVIKDCTTVDQVVTECRRFEEAKSRRIVHQFSRLPNTTATSSCVDTCSTTDEITKIVRRELEAMMPAEASSQSLADPEQAVSISVVQSVIRQELNRASQIPQRPRFQPQPADHLHNGNSVNNTYRDSNRPRRDPAAWRTPDNKPICFHCEGVGHISRYCRNRTGPPAVSSSNNRQHQFNRFYSPVYTPRPPADDRGLLEPPRFSRSPSSCRRQSLSPVPRRSTLQSRSQHLQEN